MERFTSDKEGVRGGLEGELVTTYRFLKMKGIPFIFKQPGIEKISKTRKERGLGNPEILKQYCGKPHTPNSRSKISKALKGRKASEQSIERLRQANRGRPFSEDHKMKLSLNARGRVWINKAGKNKRALQEEVQVLLEEGWVLGRI